MAPGTRSGFFCAPPALAASHCSAVFRRLSTFLPLRARSAPKEENRMAVAAPMPELAPGNGELFLTTKIKVCSERQPVMRATFPLSLPIVTADAADIVAGLGMEGSC